MSELIVALDFPEKNLALDFAKKIQNQVQWVKVGLELFTATGPEIVYELKKMGFKVFVDLKLHDIPNTVQAAVKSLIKLEADMLTLHIVGGERMVCEAVEAAKSSKHKTLLMGVTVLTSLANNELVSYTGNISDLVQNLAKYAQKWNLDGVISSGQELEKIRPLIPNLKIVCPGIRLNESGADDQRRVMTPKLATELGANYLVVGRPITKAENYSEVITSIFEQIKK